MNGFGEGAPTSKLEGARDDYLRKNVLTMILRGARKEQSLLFDLLKAFD